MDQSWLSSSRQSYITLFTLVSLSITTWVHSCMWLGPTALLHMSLFMRFLFCYTCSFYIFLETLYCITLHVVYGVRCMYFWEFFLQHLFFSWFHWHFIPLQNRNWVDKSLWLGKQDGIFSNLIWVQVDFSTPWIMAAFFKIKNGSHICRRQK